MFNTTDSTTNTSAFISKLWEMVNETKYDDLIQWCNDGTSFVIKDPTAFCSELLPIYYKHNNMASFIRQLNKYGFRKVVPLDSASLKNERTELEFAHPNFVRDYPALLLQIKRKIPNNKDISYGGVVAKLAQHVQQLQQKHNVMESKLIAMKNENNALWREHSLLRHKHQKLQKIVNKLIQFIITLVQQTRGLNIKRRPLPLMLKDTQKFPIQSYAAIKHNSNEIPLDNNIDQFDVESVGDSSSEIIIPDIIDDDTAKTILNNIEKYNNKSPQIEQISEDSPLVAVPIQEVSPAIVFGKHVKSPNSGQNNKNTPKPDSARIIVPVQEVSPAVGKYTSKIQNNEIKLNENISILNNSKTKKIINKNADSIVPLTKTIKVLKPREPSGSFILPKSVKKMNANVESTLKNNKEIKPKTLKVRNPVKLNTTPQMSIPDCTVNLPEVVVVSQDKEQQVPVNETDNAPENIEIFNVKNEVGDSITNVSSLPIILSPSGTQLSPGINTVEENQDTPSTISDQNLLPLQKDIESDLDALKELLQGEGLSFDASTLLGLLSGDDPLSFNMPDAGLCGSSASSSGNELITYNQPNLVDIIDSISDDECGDYPDPMSVVSLSLNTPKPELSSGSSSPPLKRKKK